MINLVTKLNRHASVIKIVRTLHTAKEKTQENFVTVYKFPYIRPLAAVNRLKLLQTVLTSVSIPSTVALNFMDLVSSETVQFVSALGISGCLAFYGVGFLAMKFVGFIYYNEEKEIVKVAYIDFWGKRKDVEIPLADVIPREELPSSLIDGIYVKFSRYSTKDYLKCHLKYAEIVDKDLFNKIL